MWQLEESLMRATSLRSSGKQWHSAIIFDEPSRRRSLHDRLRRFLPPAALNPFRFVSRVAMRMRDVGLARTASSLSFTTLLAVVPMATIALAFVARFPMFESWFAALEAFVFKNMLPGSAASVIHEYVLGFAEQAARLTGVSIVLIAATAGLAISTVEREINLIWGIRRRRPLARRVLVYFVGLTAGPVLLGASISLTTWFVGESLAVVPIRKTQSDLILRMLPFVFGTAGLTLLYKVVPARRVRWGPALVGGVTCGLALEAAKYAFAWYLTRVNNYQLIYGAVAALPVFLLWIHLCWVIVLAGAAISATVADVRARRDNNREDR
jgi:membrane protein